jgi:ribonuclease I
VHEATQQSMPFERVLNVYDAEKSAETEEERIERRQRREIKAPSEKRKKENGFDYLIFQLYHPINCCAQQEENAEKRKRNTRGRRARRKETLFRLRAGDEAEELETKSPSFLPIVVC